MGDRLTMKMKKWIMGGRKEGRKEEAEEDEEVDEAEEGLSTAPPTLSFLPLFLILLFPNHLRWPCSHKRPNPFLFSPSSAKCICDCDFGQ